MLFVFNFGSVYVVWFSERFIFVEKKKKKIGKQKSDWFLAIATQQGGYEDDGEKQHVSHEYSHVLPSALTPRIERIEQTAAVISGRPEQRIARRPDVPPPNKRSRRTRHRTWSKRRAAGDGYTNEGNRVRHFRKKKTFWKSRRGKIIPGKVVGFLWPWKFDKIS